MTSEKKALMVACAEAQAAFARIVPDGVRSIEQVTDGPSVAEQLRPYLDRLDAARAAFTAAQINWSPAP